MQRMWSTFRFMLSSRWQGQAFASSRPLFPVLQRNAGVVHRDVRQTEEEIMINASSAIQLIRENKANAKLTVADAIWVAVALMQRQEPNAEFSTERIVNDTQLLHLTEGTFKSIWQHVNQHCVANRPPQPNRACILFATGKGDRRLFRDGDRRDPGREGGRTHPVWSSLPTEYADLQHWYENEWNRGPASDVQDPLLAVAGMGSGMWDGLDADAYVDSLRTGWEGRA